MNILLILGAILIGLNAVVGAMVIAYISYYHSERLISSIKKKLSSSKDDEEEDPIRKCSKRELEWFLLNFYLHTVDVKLTPGEKLIFNLVPNRYMDHHCKIIRVLFYAGYCWHFAEIMRLAFNRGEVCWAVPFSHFVWKDVDGKYWDVNGKVDEESNAFFVPESYIPEDVLFVFKHTNYADNDITEIPIERYMKIVDRYAKDNNFEYDREYISEMIEKTIIHSEVLPYDGNVRDKANIKPIGED